MTDAPRVIVVAGPNGAGKTTASRSILRADLGGVIFVNADVIAQGLAALDPESVALQAGRIMLDRLKELAGQKADFAFETTLAARTYARWLRQIRDQHGYRVELYYFWVRSAEVAVNRVAARVRAGGHNIPTDTIRQRYRRSLERLFNLYMPLADLWKVYDNTDSTGYRLVAAYEDQAGTVEDERVWNLMRQGAGL